MANGLKLNVSKCWGLILICRSCRGKTDMKGLIAPPPILNRVNTKVCNIIYVLQSTHVLLGDAAIVSKTDPRSGSNKEKRSYGKVKSNGTMSSI